MKKIVMHICLITVFILSCGFVFSISAEAAPLPEKTAFVGDGNSTNDTPSRNNNMKYNNSNRSSIYPGRSPMGPNTPQNPRNVNNRNYRSNNLGNNVRNNLSNTGQNNINYTRTSATTNANNRRTDYGWIGLAGLLGLLGFIKSPRRS